MTIRKSLMTATDEDIITTAEKYVRTRLQVINQSNDHSDKDDIDYVSSCIRINDIDALKVFFTKKEIDDCEMDEDEDVRFWFWFPLAVVDKS